MFYSSLFIAITALNSLVAAQNYSTSGPLKIDPNQIGIALRQTWCNAELHSCPQICGGPPTDNACNAVSLRIRNGVNRNASLLLTPCRQDTLVYTCTCSGSKPNISAYINTIPYFVCEQWIANCVDNNPNDLKAITACRSVVCGSKNSSALSGAGASASASASASPTGGSGSGGGKGKAKSSSSSANFAAAATHFASNYGTHVLAGGMLAAFGLAL